MQIFIDSADLSEIRDVAAMGVVDGVTTNPSLVAKTGKPLRTVIREICEIVDGPISAEVISTEREAMLKEGRELASLHRNVVVKLPLTADGLKATRTLTQEGIATNVTLCFSPTQALLAAKAGATYISPFLGRIDDIAGDGMALIEQIVGIYRNYALATKVLAASIRHPLHVVQAAEIGAHVSTIPHKVILQLLRHPLTDIGLERFLADAKENTLPVNLFIVVVLACVGTSSARADDGSGSLSVSFLVGDEGDLGAMGITDVFLSNPVDGALGFGGGFALVALPSEQADRSQVFLCLGPSARWLVRSDALAFTLGARVGLSAGATNVGLDAGGWIGGGALLAYPIGSTVALGLLTEGEWLVGLGPTNTFVFASGIAFAWWPGE